MSELSFGSWVTYGNQLADDSARECMAAAHDAGVNFFDNAEVYAKGQSETIMGEALKKLGWRRSSYIVSTKFYWGLNDGPNEKNTLNRKYLMQAIDGSLARLQLDHVDLVFCHRPDPDTPIEEDVWAMHDMIRAGKALYWGTSEWRAAEIMAAWQIADKHHLAKPVMEQPQYNLFHRERVEREYARLYRRHRHRHSRPGARWRRDCWRASTTTAFRRIRAPRSRATNGLPSASSIRSSSRRCARSPRSRADLGCTLAQLALAWCLKNPHVTTVITGASRASQVVENMKLRSRSCRSWSRKSWRGSRPSSAFAA